MNRTPPTPEAPAGAAPRIATLTDIYVTLLDTYFKNPPL